MEFFDKLGKKASEAYKITADKTGKIAKETKLKFKIGELRTQINDIYEEIGKKVYEKHVREEEISIKKDLEEQCTKIDVLSDEIEQLLKECLELKDKKQCPKCYKELEKSAKFCPNCGAKQDEEALNNSKEVEILDDVEVDKVENDEQIDNPINIEEVEKYEESNETEEENNLEKTVQIESNVKIEDEEKKD